jgi:hypothetical protein
MTSPVLTVEMHQLLRDQSQVQMVRPQILESPLTKLSQQIHPQAWTLMVPQLDSQLVAPLSQQLELLLRFLFLLHLIWPVACAPQFQEL